jgi:putative toxin-antitoxin system antitoxin component (TIGR02293 family)
MMVYFGAERSIAAKLEEGVPIRDVVAFGEEAGFTPDEIARFLHLHPRTYARRRAANMRLKFAEGERAARLMRLYDRVTRAFGTKGIAHFWLNQPLHALGGRTPLDFARTEPGARQVEVVLGRYDHEVVT